MAEVLPELLQIYNTIKSNNLHYCCVCLRTENERKLVKPVAFREYIEPQVPLYVYMKNISSARICFFCEAKARAAVRFQHATKFAVAVNKLFKAMELKRLREQVENHFMSKEKIMLMNPLITDAGKCQAELSQVKNLMNLSTTNILLTNCGTPEDTEPIDVLPAVTPLMATVTCKQDLKDVVVIIDEDASDKTNSSKNDCEFIIQDKTISNQMTTNGNQLLTNSNQLITNGNLLITNSNQLSRNITSLTNVTDFNTNGKQEFVFHPIVFNTDGISTVPSLNLQIVGGNTMPLQIIPNQLQSSVGNTAFNIPNLNKKQTVLPNHANNVTSVKSYSKSSKNANKRLNKEKCDSNLLEAILQNNVRLEVTTTIIEEDDEPVQEKRNRVETGKEWDDSAVMPDKASKASELQRSPNSSRIDWEDKIPMDLISFVGPSETSSSLTPTWNAPEIANTGSFVQPISNVWPEPIFAGQTEQNRLQVTNVIVQDPQSTEAVSSPMGFITDIRSVKIDDKPNFIDLS